MKSGVAETSKMGIVNTDVEEESKESIDDPPNDGDVDQYMDFQGSNHFNTGTCDDEPDEGDPFGVSVIGSAQFELVIDLADVSGVSAPQKPKSVGIELADVMSGRGGPLTLD